MNEQTSKQQPRQRYSGPELPALLDEVMSIHGSTASITAVNRVRTGGVAGFFCREEYEVILDDDAAAADDEGDRNDEHQPGRRPSAPSRGAMVDLRVGDDDGFRHLLEEHLLNTDEAERLERARVARPAPPAALRRPAPDLDAGAGSTPTVIATSAGETGAGAVVDLEVMERADTGPEAGEANPVAGAAAAANGAPAPAATPSSRSASFWMRLYRLRREIDTLLPPTTDIHAVVGPLVQTMPVIRHLQCEAGLPADDVVVLTPRADVVSEPSWHLVHSGQQMMEAMSERRRRAAVLAIDVDVELPVWVEPLLTRLRHEGLGVTRYLLSDADQLEILLHHRGNSDGAFMIDICRPLPADELVELIDRRLPIATVAGVAINAELLLAMRGQLGNA